MHRTCDQPVGIACHAEQMKGEMAVRLFENLDRGTDFRLISVDTFERGAILVKYARQLKPNWPPLTPASAYQ